MDGAYRRIEKEKADTRLYAKHGNKKLQGILAEVNGEKALAFCKDGRIAGYTTFEELSREILTKNLPSFQLDY